MTRDTALYTMRRTFARRAAEGGMDVAELAAMMGHEPSSIPMLMRLCYRPTELHEQRAHAEARPADAFMTGAQRGERSRDPTAVVP